jgi:hypothetical protein
MPEDGAKSVSSELSGLACSPATAHSPTGERDLHGERISTFGLEPTHFLEKARTCRRATRE